LFLGGSGQKNDRIFQRISSLSVQNMSIQNHRDIGGFLGINRSFLAEKVTKRARMINIDRA
jgi:hypothetical protein